MAHIFNRLEGGDLNRAALACALWSHEINRDSALKARKEEWQREQREEREERERRERRHRLISHAHFEYPSDDSDHNNYRSSY